MLWWKLLQMIIESALNVDRLRAARSVRMLEASFSLSERHVILIRPRVALLPSASQPHSEKRRVVASNIGRGSFEGCGVHTTLCQIIDCSPVTTPLAIESKPSAHAADLGKAAVVAWPFFLSSSSMYTPRAMSTVRYTPT
jgi:hypothetical protein